MSGIFGHLNVNDTDRVFNATVGQRAIYEAATDYLTRVNAELNAALEVFVTRTTSDHSLRYKLPGGGYLQRRAADGRYGAVKAYGSWDVGFPLEDFGAMVSGNDVDMAYMTVAELDRHIENIVIQNVNQVRWEVLHRLFDNVQTTFLDPLWGTIYVEPLANNDNTLYPPVLGATTEAREQHYQEAGYAGSAISDANDPFENIICPDLVEHFGIGNATPIISFINTAEVAEVSALTDVKADVDAFVRFGDDTDVPIGPGVRYPGRLVGRHTAGTWIVEWPWIPANYILAVHIGVEAPLIRRIDPADTGLGDGLRLVTTDETFPFKDMIWRHRFGYGAGNRLNGVAVELASGGSYTVPTAYD